MMEPGPEPSPGELAAQAEPQAARSSADQNDGRLVLIVEDDRLIRRLIATVLTDAGYRCEEAADARDAWGQIEEKSFDAIVCDIEMPGESGLELVRRVRHRHPHLAILMVTASGDPATATRALDAGADGYLTKPFKSNDVVIALINVLRQRRAAQRLIAEGRQLEAASRRDPLTGLHERRGAQDALAQALEQAEAAGVDVAVLLVNVDRFALINAALGHDAADALLVAIAARLREAAGPADVVARLAADEFAIIHVASGEQSVAGLARDVHDAIRAPVAVGDQQLAVTAGVGIAIAEAGVGRAAGLLRDAGIAMRCAKDAGGNLTRVFDVSMREPWQQRLRLETELRRAIEEDQFRLFYQPIVDLRDGGLAGLEALIRWEHPEHGIVAPGRFIPIAEETGLIVELGAWVIGDACRQIREWLEAVGGASVPQISVNVSARQFAEPGFIDAVAATLRRTGVQPAELGFEITEGLLVTSGAPVSALNAAHELGVRLVLDDFGTGYSSLGYLRRFPIQTLKIDRSFVARITEEGADQALVQAILTMAATLRIPVIAEGIETREQLAVLRSLECHLVQGYLFDRPMPAPAATRLLREGRAWQEAVPLAAGGAGPEPRGRSGKFSSAVAPSESAIVARDGAARRLLKPADAAAVLGVSLSTLRRWADDHRLPIVKTPGGHRRFRAEDVRRLKQSAGGGGAAVQPILPPARPLPGLAELLVRRGDELLGATARHLYPGSVSGWFADEAARPVISRWITDLAASTREGDWDRALASSRGLMERAHVNGATLLERHRFIDSFGEATVGLVAREAASRDDVSATRRLFVSLAQSLLSS